jgi:hypothetical protein
MKKVNAIGLPITALVATALPAVLNLAIALPGVAGEARFVDSRMPRSIPLLLDPASRAAQNSPICLPKFGATPTQEELAIYRGLPPCAKPPMPLVGHIWGGGTYIATFPKDTKLAEITFFIKDVTTLSLTLPASLFEGKDELTLILKSTIH